MIIVERATEDDYTGIINIDAAITGDYSRADYLTKVIQARECWIARQGETRMGFVVFNRAFFGQQFIELLITHPDYRRQGVAAVLMQHIEKICPAPKLFTSTNESNIPMQKLCAKLGYVKSGYIENLDEGDPEIIYVKFLER